MKTLFAFTLLVSVSACATAPGTGLDEIVRGPVRVCFDRTAFDLPAGGAIVEAERGRLGTHLTGMIGPHAFEITESGSFAAPAEAGEIVFEGTGFHVRRVGDLAGSYAVYRGATDSAQQPVVRIEHIFGAESVAMDQFFRGFDPDGATRGGCQRSFQSRG